MALDATVGGASANSYGDLAEATAYFADRPDSADWVALGDDREAWLIAATDRIEQESFQGERTDEDQALSFPRYGVVVDGIEIDDDVIPERLKRAQFKLALSMGRDNPDFLKDTGLEGFERIKLDVLEVIPRISEEAGDFPEDVAREIRPLLLASSPYQFPIFRG